MRLMTLNIRHGGGGGKLHKSGYDLPGSPENLAAIAAAIRSVNPDAVALQEVRNQLQVENLARLTGMSSIYMSHPIGYRLFFFEWGLAFLHRHTLLEVDKRTVLVDNKSGVGRSALLCSIRVNRRTARMINVHFDHEQKAVQMDNVMRLLEEVAAPVCLLGDFNCTPESPLFAGLKERLADTCLLAGTQSSRRVEARGTLVGEQMRADYIWVDQQYFSVQEVGLVDEPYRNISDHIGYYADVTLV